MTRKRRVHSLKEAVTNGLLIMKNGRFDSPPRRKCRKTRALLLGHRAEEWWMSAFSDERRLV
jgi:hypothetical protein